MPECHKCPNNGRPNANCISCRGPADSNHKGASHVSIDAAPDDASGSLGGNEASLAVAAMEHAPETDDFDYDSPAAADVMRIFLAAFSEFSPRETYCAVQAAVGRPRSFIAARLRVSKQDVSAILGGLVLSNPVLRRVFGHPARPTLSTVQA